MSFFYDFLNEIKVNELSNKVTISIILNEGAMVVGKIKVISFSSEVVVLCVSDRMVKIEGENLKIKTASKGEIVIIGNVKRVSEKNDWFC